MHLLASNRAPTQLMQAWVNSVQMMAVTPETVGGCQSGVGKNYFFNYKRVWLSARSQHLCVLLTADGIAPGRLGRACFH